ncbi:hypothetical protein [Cumulibacter soli]|uniref:hypothetical protein n=1 Tax=Cumulibacter soli TaxID=2546344 RepID=UPI001068A4FA|nr:hypothetical protein [Cumulibacter soli]
MRALRSGIAVLAIAVMAGCGGTDDEPADASTESTAAGSSGEQATEPADSGTAAVAGSTALPEAGQCSTLTSEELDESTAKVATESAAGECDSAHNAITVGVVGLPDDDAATLDALVNTGAALVPDDKQTWTTVVVPACQATFDEALSAASIDTATDTVASAHKATVVQGRAWLPTAEDWDAGARWVRCDLVNYGSALTDLSTLDYGTISENLAACLAADVEGSFVAACDDEITNAQVLARVTLDAAKTEQVQANYDAFAAEAEQICADTVTAGFPDVDKPGKASLPVAFAFDGTFDCYVERVASDPLVTS